MSSALPKRLPSPLSERIADASATLYNRQGREFDVAIGGIPFMLATYPEMVQSVETIEVRKDQLDTEDPGEHSLTGWWRRSQSSFHEGAGSLYQEAVERVDSHNFNDSAGVDVFVPGQLKLLKKMVASTISGTAYSRLRPFQSSSDSGFTAVSNGTLHLSTAAAGTFNSLHAPAGKTIADGMVAADYFYDVATDGTLYEGTRAAPGSATTWPLTNTAAGAPKRLGWGKHRLWVIGGRNLWQPDVNATGGTNQAPLFTNPNKGWQYTSLAEGPAAMYFGGHDGHTSNIQLVTLDANGGIPTLTGGQVAAVLPDGELVQEIDVLGGSYIGIGTNKGFRVGVVQENGSIVYGPLILERENTNCTALTTQGRFFLVAFDTDGTNLFRIDTGTPLDGGVFPYARGEDPAVSGYLTSIAAARNDLLVTTFAGNVYHRHATQYVDKGWLLTGRIRFRTTEPKAFQFVNMDVDPLNGSIAVSLERDDGSSIPLGSITTQGVVFTDAFRHTGNPMRHAALKIELTPTGDKLKTPVVRSYLVRALPAVAPQRMIVLPLLCFDDEQSRSGQRYGGYEFGKARLIALQVLEDAGEVLTFQDFSDVGSDHRVVIDSLKFTQTAPFQKAKGPGGILVARLRTVDL